MICCSLGAVSTRPLTRSFGWNNDAVFVQHDIQELARVLTDKLEERMKNLIPEGGSMLCEISNKRDWTKKKKNEFKN